MIVIGFSDRVCPRLVASAHMAKAGTGDYELRQFYLFRKTGAQFKHFHPDGFNLERARFGSSVAKKFGVSSGLLLRAINLGSARIGFHHE